MFILFYLYILIITKQLITIITFGNTYLHQYANQNIYHNYYQVSFFNACDVLRFNSRRNVNFYFIPRHLLCTT